MFTDTTMGKIELLSWAVTEGCNLAETHYPASISNEITPEGCFKFNDLPPSPR